MSSVGNPYHNAQAESFMKTLKVEEVYTSGIGKTTQLLTLDPQRTLFLNLEAGELAVQGWPGDEIRIRDWEVARDLAAWIGGANPAMRDDQSYGPGHFARVCAAFGPASQLDKYDTVFVDSISVASRICLQWCKREYASENGTELNSILPKMSPLNPQYLTKKRDVFQRISAFVEKFKGVGGKI